MAWQNAQAVYTNVELAGRSPEKPVADRISLKITTVILYSIVYIYCYDAIFLTITFHSIPAQ